MKRMKRFAAAALLFALSVCLLPSCAQNARTEMILAMDTVFSVTLYTSNKAEADERFIACRTLLRELDDALWSRQVEGSEIARWNGGDRERMLDDRTAALIGKAISVNNATGGAFDVTLAPLSDLWQTCKAETRLPTGEELAAAKSRTGTALSIEGNLLYAADPATEIDLGGIAKGEAVALLCGMLRASGVSGGLISCGSNVAVFGSKPDGKPFRVALRDPENPTGSVGTVVLREGEVLSVSGDYERYFTVNGKRYHHILDPVSGYPAESGLSSVTVVTKDGGIADALSTALFVMGEDAANALYESGTIPFEAVFVRSDGAIGVTPGIRADFTKND